ncbi:MFS transporter [Porphyromonadaceae bacterium W3.11]|nr:MFS transporter [Porphyromonadaceae bacterium W3.11]
MTTTTQQPRKTIRDVAWIRWTVLLMISLTMLFAYMFVDVLSPLKTQLDIHLGWTSSVFGTYAGSEFFINVFLLFLIFAGIILDKMGVRFTAILSGSLMVLGAGIKVYALSTTFNAGAFPFELLSSFSSGFPPSAKLSCVGFAIFGMGTEMAGVTVSRAIVKWFHGKEMAMAMGVEMAVARLGVFAVFQTSPRIHNWAMSRLGENTEGMAAITAIQAPVLFVFILLCIGLILYLIYGVLDKKLDTQESFEIKDDEEPFRFADLKKVFGIKIFWIVALLCVLYYSAIFPFQRFATNMLESNLGLSNEKAASIFSLFPIGAMIITPPLGLFLDKKGKGATMLIIGSILMILCHGIFALYPFDTGQGSYIIAIVAIVLLGISFSLVPAALWPSVPKLIDPKVLGSAYSAIFFIQNIGLMTVPMLIGKVLDITNKGIEPEQALNYTPSMLIFTSFGVLALILSTYLKTYDKKMGFGLEKPNIQK